MGHAQFHTGPVLVLDVNLIISLVLGQQLTVDMPVVQHYVALDDIPLLADLPHIEGNMDHVPPILLLNLGLKKIPHAFTSVPGSALFPAVFILFSVLSFSSLQTSPVPLGQSCQEPVFLRHPKNLSSSVGPPEGYSPGTYCRSLIQGPFP